MFFFCDLNTHQNSQKHPMSTWFGKFSGVAKQFQQTEAGLAKPAVPTPVAQIRPELFNENNSSDLKGCP